MSQPELLKRLIDILNANRIEYMVTGSIVSSLQGEPRSTHDIDVLVHIPLTAIPALTAAFPLPDYYISEQGIRDAVMHKSMFNLLDTKEGDKIDFWILTDDPFDVSRFRRKYASRVFGLNVNVSQPEDTILAKLRWAKLSGGSQKHFTDALRVYEVQCDRIDHDYLRDWSIRIGVKDLL